jgi:hypothetical protein
MATKIYNVQRVSDGKTYQANGTWAQGQGTPYDFASESDVETFLGTQSSDRWRLNILYKD